MKNELIRAVTAQDFEAEVMNSELPVLVDFTTEWCGPCNALKPVLQRIATEERGRLKVCTVDGDAHPELTTRFGVRGYPTVIAFANGRELARSLGLTTRDRLVKLASAPAAA